MADPQTLLRSRGYVGLLVVAAIIGVPVSAAAYGFLALVDYLQKEIFTHLPHGLGFQAVPVWWPLPVLAVGGVLIALAIRYLPGRGGPSPAGGFKMHGAPAIAELPGVVLAALATLVFGTVLDLRCRSSCSAAAWLCCSCAWPGGMFPSGPGLWWAPPEASPPSAL